MLYKDGKFHVNLSVSINLGGATTVPQGSQDRGTHITIDKDTGEIDYVAGGLRTPHGMGWGPEGEIFVTDNQGGWLPASKLLEIKPGEFYNHYTTEKDGTPGRFDDQPVTKPVLWMPQNEIANSPSTPVVVEEGPYAGQMFIGDVTYGGLQRADLEKVDGRYQGALFRMTQGLEAGVSRVLKRSRRLADHRWPRRRRQLGPERQAPLRPAEARPQRDRSLRHAVDGRRRGWLRDRVHPAALGRDPRGPRVASTRSSSGATAPPHSTAVPSSTRRPRRHQRDRQRGRPYGHARRSTA